MLGGRGSLDVFSYPAAPIAFIVVYNNHIILDSYAYQSLAEAVQVSNAGEWVPLLHVNEVEEVCDVRSKYIECMFNHLRIRAAFSNNQELTNSS